MDKYSNLKLCDLFWQRSRDLWPFNNELNIHVLQYLQSFHITNFPFLSSNIPSSPAYEVFYLTTHLIRQGLSSYECFIMRAVRLSNKLLGQGYVKERSKSSLRKFNGRYGYFTKQYEVPLENDHIQWHPPLMRHYTNFWSFTDLDLIT